MPRDKASAHQVQKSWHPPIALIHSVWECQPLSAPVATLALPQRRLGVSPSKLAGHGGMNSTDHVLPLTLELSYHLSFADLDCTSFGVSGGTPRLRASTAKTISHSRTISSSCPSRLKRNKAFSIYINAVELDPDPLNPLNPLKPLSRCKILCKSCWRHPWKNCQACPRLSRHSTKQIKTTKWKGSLDPVKWGNMEQYHSQLLIRYTLT